MQSKILFNLIIVFSILALTGCADRIPVDACRTGDVYGFLGGLWHGIIAPFGLIMMIFKNDVGVFASCNNGFWYAFGFLLGSGGWGILASKSKK